ncbi:MAG: DUF1376 domain-containing protein [Spirochaetaceae bacterium]|nr:DUF1376 domain-containing protein [Spirochaetaceae bacterium]
METRRRKAPVGIERDPGQSDTPKGCLGRKGDLPTMPENPPIYKPANDDSEPFPHMPYAQFWWDDYDRKTKDLLPLEHGCYFLLLKSFYQGRGRPLPADPERLYRLVGALSKVEQDAVCSVLGRYWHEVDGGYVNHRAMSEMEAYRDKVAKRSKAGKRGGRPPKSKPKAIALANEKQLPPQKSEVRIQNSEERLKRKHTNTPPAPAREIAPNGACASVIINQDDLETIWREYPGKSGASRKATIKALKHRVREGRTIDDLVAAARRYRSYCDATCVLGTQYVMTPQSFFRDAENVDEQWEHPAPAMTRAQKTEKNNRQLLDEQLAEIERDRKAQSECAHDGACQYVNDRGIPYDDHRGTHIQCLQCNAVMPRKEPTMGTFQLLHDESEGQETVNLGHGLEAEPVDLGDGADCQHPTNMRKLLTARDATAKPATFAMCLACGAGVAVDPSAFAGVQDEAAFDPAAAAIDGGQPARAVALTYTEAIG